LEGSLSQSEHIFDNYDEFYCHEESKAMGLVFFLSTGFTLAASDDRFAPDRFAGHVFPFRK
jgi:hypothetical protein